MKIVTWNCNGAFRKKFENIEDFGADIYIIQECENPAECQDQKYRAWAENYIWVGDTKHRGLAVFAKPDIELKKLNWANQYNDHVVKHFLACKVNQSFDLLAVWNHLNNSPTFGYIGQLWKYLQVNKKNLDKIIIAGDFNSNAIWDKWDRWWNHSDVVRELKDLGVESIYHKHTGEKQGEETNATLYFRRNKDRPYHIDYVFGSQEFYNRIVTVKIGSANEWLEISDHTPILCEFL